MTRVVSLVPSWTASLFDLGVGDCVVGVTRYCEEPAAAIADLPKVGGTKNPKRDAIADLEPDLVLVNTEENRAEDIAWLRERFEVMEAMPRTVLDAADVLREFGRRLDCTDAVESCLLDIEANLLRCQSEALGLAPLRVFYPIWRKPWMSINRDTYIDSLIRAAGGNNVCCDRAERYPELSEENLAGLDVDLVLLPSEPWAFTAEQRETLLTTEVFGDAPLELVDGRDFCWHGSRTGAAIGRVHDLFLAFRARR